VRFLLNQHKCAFHVVYLVQAHDVLTGFPALGMKVVMPVTTVETLDSLPPLWGQYLAVNDEFGDSPTFTPNDELQPHGVRIAVWRLPPALPALVAVRRPESASCGGSELLGDVALRPPQRPPCLLFTTTHIFNDNRCGLPKGDHTSPFGQFWSRHTPVSGTG
jgi:hypothetical protein